MAPHRHRDLRGAGAIHQANYVQASDPGAVGADLTWIDTSSGPPYVLKVRNGGNSAWAEVGSVSGSYISPGTGTTASAPGDSTSHGSSDNYARTDHHHGRESFATPAIALGDTAAAGAAGTPMRSDATIAAFDGSTPDAEGFGDSGDTGAAAYAARADHHHAMPTSTAGPDADVAIDSTGAAGSANTAARAGHGHKLVTSSSNPQPLGTASPGSGGSVSRGNHVHPMTGVLGTTDALGGDLTGTHAAALIAQISRSWGLTGVVTAAITADTNDLSATGLSDAGVLLLLPDAEWRLTGIGGGYAGRVLAVFNAGVDSVFLGFDDAGSSSGNQFGALPGNADLELVGNSGVLLWYDDTYGHYNPSLSSPLGAWRLIGNVGAVSGSPGSPTESLIWEGTEFVFDDAGDGDEFLWR